MKKAEEIGEDAAELAGEATSFAAVSVMKALKALSNDEDLEDQLEMIEDQEDDIEAMADRIEERAEEIEEQADRLVDLADELRDRVPELDELDWFLDRCRTTVNVWGDAVGAGVIDRWKSTNKT